MEKKMESSKSGMSLKEYFVKLGKRLWNDILVWAMVFPLVYTVFYLWTDWYAAFNIGLYMVAAISVVFVFCYERIMILMGLLSANAGVVSASNNISGDKLWTVTDDYSPKWLGRFRSYFAYFVRSAVIGGLAFLPLIALINSTERSLQIKLQNDCLIKKIEAIEDKTGQQIICDRF
jgi:hypothetical protein